MRTLLVVTAVAAIVAVAACGSARRGVPLNGPIQHSADGFHGKILFMHNCNQCHPGGDAAVGPAINNKWIPDAVMKLQIRKGVLGSMPAFSDKELSDQDVDHILIYLNELRKRKAK
jgi:mono/diheme cytochrome c family protein